MGGFVDSLTGDDAADASKDAARIQAETARSARSQQDRFLRTIRRDFAPYRDVGAQQLPQLNALINDPTAQLNFIQNNPFFKGLADDAQNRLMNVQAAGGRLGTGDTPAFLQNKLLMLGNDLLQQSIGNRMNLGTMGLNASAQTGGAMQNIGNNMMNLTTGAGDAFAAGQVGAANARSQGTNNLLNLALTGAGIFLSDRRFKTDVEVLGKLDCGIPVCSFRYVGGTDFMVGVMAQDVEKVVPGAVVDVFGVKYVDYDELQRVLH